MSHLLNYMYLDQGIIADRHTSSEKREKERNKRGLKRAHRNCNHKMDLISNIIRVYHGFDTYEGANSIINRRSDK